MKKDWNKTHGMSNTSTYQIWCGMIARCRKPSHGRYKYYGGRGIKVCDRWLKFENFLADMGERPGDLTLDRINNDGNYEPGNCRWAHHIDQIANRRFTKRRQNVTPSSMNSDSINGLDPSKKKQPKCRFFGRVDAPLAEAVKKEAAKKDLSLNFVMNQALFDWLKKEAKK